MREVILLRHGESEDNVTGRVTGQSDASLTPRGVAQAEAAAARIVELGGAAAIYASDQRRAIDTAAPVAAALKLDVIPHAGFRERAMGVYTGLYVDDLRRHHRDAFMELYRRSATYQPPEGESLNECSDRAVAAFSHVLATAPEGRIVIVSHAATITMLIERALLRMDNGAVTFRSENGALHRFQLTASNEIRVLAINDVEHLPPSLRSESATLTALLRPGRGG